MFFTTLICLNQAIQPEVVGPLFYLKGIDLFKRKTNPIGFGTSIDYVNCVCKINKLCEPWPVGPRQER